jgi:uncharacterized flavoprotein (TIGR03862 family)
MSDALIIGGGPAGLMAADALLSAGYSVTLTDAKPSLARKFLMAGKSGLNLTKMEPLDAFLAAYGTARPQLEPMIRAFGPQQVQNWAQSLGQETFTGSTGRLFPTAMKASPLLRAWLRRLEGLGLDIRTRWRWSGWQENCACFDTPDGPQKITAKTTIFALGGASWARLGSDGAWVDAFAALKTPLAPFAPSNCGVLVDWSTHMTAHFGSPLKNIRLTAGALSNRGEVVISANGIEGGGLYPLTPALRVGAPLQLDLFPETPHADLSAKLARSRSKQSLSNTLRKLLKLPPQSIALAMEMARPLPKDPAQLAQQLKALPLRYTGLPPMDQAISTAGGLRFEAVNDDLMLTTRPGTFCAGEMLDWEAPTGGYLLTACLATGLWAGRGAVKYLQTNPG